MQKTVTKIRKTEAKSQNWLKHTVHKAKIKNKLYAENRKFVAKCSNMLA